jgi:hypothetical protein
MFIRESAAARANGVAQTLASRVVIAVRAPDGGLSAFCSACRQPE